MRVGLVSDVHGNLQALRTVLERLDAERLDLIACLGDIVGYGGDPEACLELVRERASICVLGNHDAAAIHPEVRRTFNAAARVAIEAHAGWLSPSATAYLASLPAAERIGNAGGDHAFLTHGTPGESRLFTYLISPAQAGPAFRTFPDRFGAVGHTHVPALFEQDGTAGWGARARIPATADRASGEIGRAHV